MHWIGLWMLVARTALGPASATAATPTPPPVRHPAQVASRFIRLQRAADGTPRALDTAIVRYRLGTATVDLIAVIHVGDPAYYADLDRRLDDYDAVLYELVADGEQPMPDRDGGANPLRALQDGVTDALALTHQLDGLRYDRPSFVHADMSPGELQEAMARGGESIVGLLAKLLEGGAQADIGPNEVDLTRALLLPAEKRPLALKRLLAPELAATEKLVPLIEGSGGTSLIARRNEVAVETLGRALADGRQQLAILYGAAHMADLERRLKQRFAARRGATRWLTAWDLRGGRRP